MTTPESRSVSYLCPQCHAALTAREDAAGQRQVCRNCGKTVKVPGRPGAAPSADRAEPPPRREERVSVGIANVAVLCPVCGTRMYATREQLGTSMVCPDCLETVPIPIPTPIPSPAPVPRPPQAGVPRPVPSSNSAKPSCPVTPPPATGPPATGPPEEEDDGGLRLSDLIETPSDKILPRRLMELLRDGAPVPGEDVTDWPVEPEATRPKVKSVTPKPTEDEYSVKCPVCDTLLYASPDDIGTRKACPDCHSSVEITAPRRKSPRVNPVRDEDYEGHEFALSEPVSLDIYRQTERGENPKTLGETALRNAEREYDRKHTEEVEQPITPLWTGLFSFLPASPVILRWILFALVVGFVCRLSLLILSWDLSDGVIQKFYSLVGTTAQVMLLVLTTLTLGATCLTILQDSANGQDEITQWPEGGPFEMIAGAMPFAMAVFFALLPGAILYALAGTVGIMSTSRWIVLEISLYFLFPVVQLSILESGSLMTPFSHTILQSLRDEFLLWLTFYLTSLALALILAVTLAGLKLNTPFLVLAVLGALWIFLLFLYFRLLGRLAWATQVHALLKNDSDSETKEQS